MQYIILKIIPQGDNYAESTDPYEKHCFFNSLFIQIRIKITVINMANNNHDEKMSYYYTYNILFRNMYKKRSVIINYGTIYT